MIPVNLSKLVDRFQFFRAVMAATDSGIMFNNDFAGLT